MAERRDPDAVSRLAWAFRRYLGLVFGLILLMVVLVAVLTPAAPADEYESRALVVAQRLEGVRAEHLPRMAEAIFTGNNVARQTVAETDLEIRPQELVPLYAEIEVVEGTVVMRVIGRSVEPRLAADIANAAAQALVDELERLGPDVGSFALHETAPVPQDPAPGPMRPPPLLLGLLTGVIFGLGGAGLLLVFRRPVITLEEAVDRVGAPLTGVLELSRGGHFDALEDVPASVPLADELYPLRREVNVVVAANNATTRSQVSVALARVLARSGPVVVIAARDRAGRRAARLLRNIPQVRMLGPQAASRTLDQSARGHEGPVPVVADGRPGTRFALPTSLEPVLVVAEGVPEQRLRRAVSHLQPQRPRSLVWVAPRGGMVRGFVRRLLAPPPREAAAAGEESPPGASSTWEAPDQTPQRGDAASPQPATRDLDSTSPSAEREPARSAGRRSGGTSPTAGLGEQTEQ